MAGIQEISARKLLSRLMAALCATAILLTASACGKNKTGDPSQAEGSATKETLPPAVFTVTGKTAKAGDKQVEVTVSITDNPGIFGMDFDLCYDDTALVLTDAQSSSDIPDYCYTRPSYYRNPTTFLWDFQDMDWAADGVILTLHFDVLETAAPGSYEVTLMHSYGNIFDSNGEPIEVKVTNGYVTVEE